jgi:DNA-binding transcriptional LysR family regulator
MRQPGLDLNLLLVFEALLRERSVSRAARSLRQAQSSLSSALARLRAQLGDELFVRGGGAMQPTAFALSLAPGVVQALGQLRATLERTRRFVPEAARATFTLASTDYTSFVLLPRIVAAVTQAAPGVSLRVVEYHKDDVARSLASGQVELALGVFPDPRGEAVVTKLFSEHFVGVCRPFHPGLGNAGFSLAAYVAAPHALVSVRGDAVGEIDRVLAARGLSRDVRLVVPHLMALPGTLRGTDLVAAIPARAAARFLGEGLRTFKLPFATPRWDAQMMWSATRRREPANAWLRGIVKVASEATGS